MANVDSTGVEPSTIIPPSLIDSGDTWIVSKERQNIAISAISEIMDMLPLLRLVTDVHEMGPAVRGLTIRMEQAGGVALSAVSDTMEEVASLRERFGPSN